MTKLNNLVIRALQVPEGAKDIQAFDDDLPGFGVASGKASLLVKYSIGKQQRRKTLGPWVPGTLPAIRKEATVVLAQVRLGKDVVGEARKAQQEAKNAKTLGEIVAPRPTLTARGALPLFPTLPLFDRAAGSSPPRPRITAAVARRRRQGRPARRRPFMPTSGPAAYR